MGGREGLVDTAVKTAETGYMQRRLVKVGMRDMSLNLKKNFGVFNLIHSFKTGISNFKFDLLKS